MCDGVTKINTILSGRGVKKLHCQADSSCWCAKLRARFTHENDTCLSPAELLNASSAILGNDDLIYLRKLAAREFVPIDFSD